MRISGGTLNPFSSNPVRVIDVQTIVVSGGEISGGYVFNTNIFAGIWTIDLLGGRIGNHSVFGRATSASGSVLVAGTQIGENADFGVSVTITGGSIGDKPNFYWDTTISGGSIGDNASFYDALVLSGGSVGEYANFLGDVDGLSIIGKRFILDGVEISQTMTVGETRSINVRDVLLSGELLDGSGFEFLLNTDDTLRGTANYFAEDIEIEITYVPEPASAAALILGLLSFCNRRRAA